MEWIDLAQDRGKWRALVNTVMNLGVPQNCGQLLIGRGTRRLFQKDSAPWSWPATSYRNTAYSIATTTTDMRP